MNHTFAQRWQDKERNSGLATSSEGMVRTTVEVSGFDVESLRLLIESGLPASAAPCLSFCHAATLPRIWEIFAPGQWDDKQKAALSQYQILGTDGAGNPICVEDKTGKVWLLDHEDWFHTRQFVNSSVVHLAECLLCYMGQRDAELFSKEVKSIDARALEKGCFWSNEVGHLREGCD